MFYLTSNIDCSLYIVGGAYVFIYLESDLEELEKTVETIGDEYDNIDTFNIEKT